MYQIEVMGRSMELEDEFKNIVPIRYEDRYKVINDIDIVISATCISSYSYKI